MHTLTMLVDADDKLEALDKYFKPHENLLG